MGTSADLAVRFGGRTYFQHTSYDAQTENILASILSTWAACGTDALRARMSLEEERLGPSDETADEEEDFFIDRRTMGNNYLLACEARGKSPVLLDQAMGYEFGNPDFTHGGLVSLFAPQIDWRKWCSSLEDAGVVLDLDLERLVLRDWNKQADVGSYDQGFMPARFEIPFSMIDDLDPELIYCTLRGAYDLGDDDTGQSMVDDLLNKIRAGGVALPAPFVGAAQGVREARQGVHTLMGHAGVNGHKVHLRAVVHFLRWAAPDLFGANGVFLFTPSDRSDVDALLLDLRGEQASQLSGAVKNVFSRLAREEGMVYSHQGDGFLMHVSSNGSSASSGNSSNTAWDEGIIPENATNVIVPDPFEDALARGYDKALIDAVVHLDEEAWTAIENSGRLLELLSEEIMTSAIGFAVFMATMFEEGWPGSTNERFQALSKSHQKIFLGNMEPIDRFLFARLIKENSTAKIAPKM